MILYWIFIILLGAVGIRIIIFNTQILLKGVIKGEHCPSIFGLFGGILTAIAFYIIPNNEYRHLFWIPLILDWGCIPAIMRCLYVVLFLESKDEDKFLNKAKLDINF